MCSHLVAANNRLQQLLEIEAGVLLQPFPQGLLRQLQEALLDLHHVDLWSKQHQFLTPIQNNVSPSVTSAHTHTHTHTCTYT